MRHVKQGRERAKNDRVEQMADGLTSRIINLAIEHSLLASSHQHTTDPFDMLGDY